MVMGMSTDSLLEPQFSRKLCSSECRNIAKTETENGTTMNLNPKKAKQAKTEIKNGTT
jgi:hypothetical protein